MIGCEYIAWCPSNSFALFTTLPTKLNPLNPTKPPLNYSPHFITLSTSPLSPRDYLLLFTTLPTLLPSPLHYSPRLTADDPLRSTASVPTLIQVTDMAHDGFKDGGSTDLLTVPEGTEQVEMVELEQEDGSKQVEVRIEQEGEEEVDKSEEEVEEEEREGEEEEEEEEEEEDEVQSQIDDVVIKV